jgi:hypothetical protein
MGQHLGQQTPDLGAAPDSAAAPAEVGTIEHSDFREIAHSGGKIIFRCVCTEEGRKKYQLTFTGSRPVPMSMFGIYAIARGDSGCRYRPRRRPAMESSSSSLLMHPGLYRLR